VNRAALPVCQRPAAGSGGRDRILHKRRFTSGPIGAFNTQVVRLIHRSCGIANLGHLFLKMRAKSLQRI